jgi:hypothetical protein
MTDKYAAIKELAETLSDSGVEYYVQPKKYGEHTYFKGRRFSIYCRIDDEYVLVRPDSVSSIDDIKELKEPLKEIKDADDFPPAYFEKGSTEIEYSTVAIGNADSFQTGTFYPFDDKNILTHNLVNLLEVIKGHEDLNHDLGVLLQNDVVKAEDRSSEPCQAWPNAVNWLKGWLVSSGLDCWDNLNPGGFNFSHYGLIVKSKNKNYFVLVSNGTDTDLVRQYIETKNIRQSYRNQKPNLNGNDINLDGIVIASPHSYEGKLFTKDRIRLHNQQVTHINSSDFMPKREYAKSFQYCRLPFYLFRKGDKGPFVHTMLSSKIDGTKTAYPMLSIMYTFNGEAKHKMSRLAANTF